MIHLAWFFGGIGVGLQIARLIVYFAGCPT
jgi:hypothetical protein